MNNISIIDSKMSDWVCYLIRSLDSNCTYVGSTNNMPKRLAAHNSTNKSRKGARRTCGQTWTPMIVVSGFNHKNACLSFEAGWKRLAKYRNNKKLEIINIITKLNLRYTNRDRYWDRILDLLFFVHNFTFIGTKFKLNYQQTDPTNCPIFLTINVFLDDWIKQLPWPFFIRISNL